jgi:hypothetical protein
MTSVLLIFLVLLPVGLSFFLREKDGWIFSILSVIGLVGVVIFGFFGCTAMLTPHKEIVTWGFQYCLLGFGLLIGSEIGRKIGKKKAGTQ